MWALWRRFVYGLTLVIIFLVPISYFSYQNLYKSPTCKDGLQNGEEAGVDCGGSCALLCSADVIPVETSFAKFFRNDDGTYDVGIMLLNKNSGSAPLSLKLTVILKSKEDKVLLQKDLQTIIPLASDLPIVLQGLRISGIPDKVIVVKEEGYSYVLKNKIITPVKLATSFDQISKNGVYVTLTNTTKKDLLRFPVRVVLYDEQRRPLGISESTVGLLSGGETKTIEVIFGHLFEREPTTIRAYAVLDPYAF